MRGPGEGARDGLPLVIRPLAPDLWPALEDLLGESGAVGGCWCMYWRIGRSYRQEPPTENKSAFKEIVMRGPPPGLIAFAGEVQMVSGSRLGDPLPLAVGWCQVTPRDALPWLDRTWRLKRVDDLPVWSLSCLYIRKGYRRRGIATALIAAALAAAKRANAPALEAYPLDGDKSPSATSTGYVSTFLRAGFTTVACRTPPRPVMRHDLIGV